MLQRGMLTGFVDRHRWPWELAMALLALLVFVDFGLIGFVSARLTGRWLQGEAPSLGEP